jgi:riboflavin kinase/FMN adenylyltransferase
VEVVQGVERLSPALGPIFVVVGVFDGLHLGHAYLLRHLVAEAVRHGAAPTVITFDHHPDEVLVGNAPPLLIDPDERLERLASAGVGITVVQHFDDELRRTTYDAFVERIRARVELRGFLMTPDAAFGFERRGTPAALATMGERDGFEVVVVPPFDLHGRQVRSMEIRELIQSGDLAGAGELLGRPVTLTGTLAGGRLSFALPMAIPPDGRYEAQADGRPAVVNVEGGEVFLPDVSASRHISIEFA